MLNEHAGQSRTKCAHSGTVNPEHCTTEAPVCTTYACSFLPTMCLRRYVRMIKRYGGHACYEMVRIFTAIQNKPNKYRSVQQIIHRSISQIRIHIDGETAAGERRFGIFSTTETRR